MMLAKLLVLLATIGGMSNKEHLRVVRAGAEAIREWRVANPGRKLDLIGAHLIGAGLRSAILRDADLRDADLRDADLRAANLRRAMLSGADLRAADLRDADVGEAILAQAELTGASLDGVLLAGAAFYRTALGGLDLAVVSQHELESVRHEGPSDLSTSTLTQSRGMIPEEFLRGCGLSDWEIENAKLYGKNLKPHEVADIQQRVFNLRTEDAIRLHPVFLSHGQDDKPFVKKLHDSLQEAGVRCWLDEKQLVPGDDLHEAIDRGVTVFDKFVLVCSKASLSPRKSWVKREIRRALAKEEELTERFGKPTRAIVPIRIDDYALDDWTGDGLMRSELQSRVIGDFRNHEDDDAFKANLELLIKALRADAGGREPDPQSLFGMGGEA